MNIHGQHWKAVLVTTASLAASGSTSGSIISLGYSRLIGMAIMSGSGDSASAVTVYESADYGSNWDISTISALSEDSASGFSVSPLHGNAVMVRLKAGLTDTASVLRASFYVSPI